MPLTANHKHNRNLPPLRNCCGAGWVWGVVGLDGVGGACMGRPPLSSQRRPSPMANLSTPSTSLEKAPKPEASGTSGISDVQGMGLDGSRLVQARSQLAENYRCSKWLLYRTPMQVTCRGRQRSRMSGSTAWIATSRSRDDPVELIQIGSGPRTLTFSRMPEPEGRHPTRMIPTPLLADNS